MRAPWLCTGLALALAAPLRADEPKKVGLKTYEVPYQLTKTLHILVRAKINGKGPFNFIVDTGAPLLYITTSAAKKIGLPVKMEKREKDKKEIEKGGNVEVLDRFDIEGGPGHRKIKALVETPFQLECMNAMGLPGEELHVAVIREGKEFHQGVGYLEDGTMIVVEHGRRLIGEETDVIVTSVLQTVAGRMIFARPKREGVAS